jgi:predicted nucleic acid-binding protein
VIALPLFLDSNIFMYAAGSAHRYKQPCLAILSALERGRLAAVINTEIIQEMLYRYSHIGLADKGVELCRAILKYRITVLPVTERDALLAVDLFDTYRTAGISPRDAVHAATMQNSGIAQILSTDGGFDVFPFLRRVDPVVYAAAL